MNSVQYEELCRYFIAQKTGLPMGEIRSLQIANPKRGDIAQYGHQIDQYWETSNEVCRYVRIANAKWRSSAKVDQAEVLLLQRVKQEVAALKAVMISNTGFTSGAEAVAADKGIALHVVQPDFDSKKFPGENRELILAKLLELASVSSGVFKHVVCHKVFHLGGVGLQTAPSQAVAVSCVTNVPPQYTTRVADGHLPSRASRNSKERVANDPVVEASIKGNSPGNAQLTINQLMNDKLQDMVDSNGKFYKQVKANPDFAQVFLSRMVEKYARSRLPVLEDRSHGRCEESKTEAQGRKAG